MLGGANKTISVVVTQNDEVIVTKKRCKITIEDFQNVHVMTTTELTIVEKALQIALQLTPQLTLEFFVHHLSNDFEGSLCKLINNTPRVFETNITSPKTNVVLLPRDFSNILK